MSFLTTILTQQQQVPPIPLPCMVISSYGQTFLNLTLIKFPIWPSWTWGDGATVRDHPEMRAETD